MLNMLNLHYFIALFELIGLDVNSKQVKIYGKYNEFISLRKAPGSRWKSVLNPGAM